MALWLAFAAAAAAVAPRAHAAVQNEAPSAGIVETERRLLVDTQYSYTYHYGRFGHRTKEIRTCIDCLKTTKYSDRNGCPDGFNIWVPEDYYEANEVRNEWLAGLGMQDLTALVGVFRMEEGKSGERNDEQSCGGCKSVPMNSVSYDEWQTKHSDYLPWISVAGQGKPWFIRSTTYSQPDGNYDAGCWLNTNKNGGWDNNEGFKFDDDDCHYSFIDYLCEACPAGRFKVAAEFGPTNYYCKECYPGYYSGPGQGECTACPEGKYASAYGSTACTDCPAGKSTWGIGNRGEEGNPAKSPLRCETCLPGHFASCPGSKCIKCPDGTICDPQGDIWGGLLPCDGTTCTECPAGTESNSEHTECVTCPDGYVSRPGTMCEECPGTSCPNSDHSFCKRDCTSNLTTQQLSDELHADLRVDSDDRHVTSRVAVAALFGIVAFGTAGIIAVVVKRSRHAGRVSHRYSTISEAATC